MFYGISYHIKRHAKFYERLNNLRKNSKFLPENNVWSLKKTLFWPMLSHLCLIFFRRGFLLSFFSPLPRLCSSSSYSSSSISPSSPSQTFLFSSISLSYAYLPPATNDVLVPHAYSKGKKRSEGWRNAHSLLFSHKSLKTKQKNPNCLDKCCINHNEAKVVHVLFEI